jgi:glycine/D-amino acid oxidase-like deaminating enzyme
MENVFDRRSKSLWMDIDVAPTAGPMQGDQTCDVVVVGSGVAGISTAYELAIEGQRVVVVDRGTIAGGITARTSAHLAPLCDDLTSAMIHLRGEDVSRLFYESQAAAVDRIEEIQKNEKIDCDFRRLDGYLFQALNTDAKIIDDELDAVRKVGAPVQRLVGIPLRNCEKQHALRYPRQATFHPLKYLRGLVAVIEAKGGALFSNTIVEAVEEEEGGAVVVRTNFGIISARSAVVATNSPIVDRFALHTKMAPYRTYAMAFSIRRALFRMPYTGIRLIPITMFVFNRARTEPTTSLSAAPITRAATPMMRNCASRRWKHGPVISFRPQRRSPIAGRDRCSTRLIMPASSAEIPATRISIFTPVIPARASPTG